jgi:hypothetical protein
MGATGLTLPSCPPTWARSVVLTNSACRSWGNGSSPVVRCWLRPKRQTASENFQDRDLGVEATGEQLLAEPGINRPTSWLLGG